MQSNFMQDILVVYKDLYSSTGTGYCLYCTVTFVFVKYNDNERFFKIFFAWKE